MFLDQRELVHATLATLLAAALDDCRVERNTDAPTDWETIAETRVVIIRDGGFVPKGERTGQTIWIFVPVIEGHVRGATAAELGARSNTLLVEVAQVLEDHPTLDGACEDLTYQMPDTPELNIEPTVGSLLAWQLAVAAEVEQRTAS